MSASDSDLLQCVVVLGSSYKWVWSCWKNVCSHVMKEEIRINIWIIKMSEWFVCGNKCCHMCGNEEQLLSTSGEHLPAFKFLQVTVWTVCLFYFRTPERCYNPEGERLVWRRAERGAVVGWTWFWSDMPTWSMASLRKEPVFQIYILTCRHNNSIFLLQYRIKRLVCLFLFCRIALTKLDILDTLPEIKVGVAYKVDGQPLASFPGRSFSLVIHLLTEQY